MPEKKPKKPEEDEEELVADEPDLEEQMRQMMGFASFDTTKVWVCACTGCRLAWKRSGRGAVRFALARFSHVHSA